MYNYLIKFYYMKWNTEIDLDKNNVWFTSDLHLFHENVILMNKRPFKDVYEMYEYFKNEWNSKVKPNDYVFILGDVLWGSQATRLESMVNTLNGNICIVLGNHDKEKLEMELLVQTLIVFTLMEEPNL